MKALWLVGLLALLLTVAYDKVGPASSAAQRPAESVVPQSAVAIEDKGLSAARLSEYAFLHQAARERDIPLHRMSAAPLCPE
jgi:hypothetical protein